MVVYFLLKVLALAVDPQFTLVVEGRHEGEGVQILLREGLSQVLLWFSNHLLYHGQELRLVYVVLTRLAVRVVLFVLLGFTLLIGFLRNLRVLSVKHSFF